jgi:ribosomal protein S27AE
MSERIKCPSCGADLILAETAGEWRATCPRCLAEIDVPEATPAPDAVQAERPERREGGLSCPHCGRTVEAVWITCPWCEEPLRGRERGRNGAADLDVRRDTKRTSPLVIVLAVIGGIGVAWSGLGVFSAGAQGDYSALLYLAVPLLFLAGVSTLIVFLRSGGNPGASGFRRVIVDTLALVGGMVILGGLTILAFIIYFLVICGAMFRSH